MEPRLAGRSDPIIIHADCLDALREMADESIDAVVTDPPYGLEFMGKDWDRFRGEFSDGSFKGFVLPTQQVRNVKCPDCGKWSYDHPGRKCECGGVRRAQVNAFQQWCGLWASELLRVLKPGGHLLAFGGTRTYHRLASAIEDAGFEIRDSIHWIYGNGFPKSLDVSKAIDKAAGAQREVVGRNPNGRPAKAKGAHAGVDGQYGFGAESSITAPATEDAVRWQGWGTALKPAHEPIVVARKPLAGTVVETVLAYGTGALNIDATRVGFRSEADERESKDKNRHADFGSPSGGNAVYNDYSMVPRKNYAATGRWSPNLLLTHAEGCRQTGTAEDTFGGGAKASGGFVEGYEAGDGFEGRTVEVPVWECVEGCPVREMDDQSGIRPGGAYPARRGQSHIGFASGQETEGGARQMGDTGGASRFFPVFHAEGCREVVPVWECSDDCPVREMDSQSGTTRSSGGRIGKKEQGTVAIGGAGEYVAGDPGYGDSGGASRFFPAFRYQAKANKRERNAGLEGLPERPRDPASYGNMKTRECRVCKSRANKSGGQPACGHDDWEWVEQIDASKAPTSNHHPTVKPVELMRWLVRLVTPPGGVVLDPFTGSGTTGVAAVREGFDFVGIERDDEYVQIARLRIAHAVADVPAQGSLWSE